MAKRADIARQTGNMEGHKEGSVRDANIHNASTEGNSDDVQERIDLKEIQDDLNLLLREEFTEAEFNKLLIPQKKLASNLKVMENL